MRPPRTPLWRTLPTGLVALLLVLLMAACGGSGDAEQAGGGGGEKPNEPIAKIPGAERTKVTIGSKNFTEQFVLGEIYSQALEAAGFKVERELNLGDAQIAFKALKGGNIDAYPEYTGTALVEFFDVPIADVPAKPMEVYEEAKSEFAKDDITALPPTKFNNTYVLAMKPETAKKLGNPTKISDLEGKAGDLRITGFPECEQRADCLIGLRRTYGLDFGEFIATESKYEPLDGGQTDIGLVFSTDGQLTTGKYVTLEDDKGLFPAYNISLAMRDDELHKIGQEGRDVLLRVQAPMTDRAMQELNSRVDLQKQQPEEVAAAYLREEGFVR